MATETKRLGLEKEITTTSSLSLIEKKLPTDVKKERAKLASSGHSTLDKMNKFPSFLKFFLNQKQAIEYENAELQNDSKTKGSCTLFRKKQQQSKHVRTGNLANVYAMKELTI